MKQKFYLTTAIPYVNAAPHVGFGLEIVQTDTIARYHRLIGDDVFFLTGSDENSLKNVQAAQEEGISPQALCDKYAAKFKALKEALNLSFDDFIRTSDKKRHWPGAQKLWQACDQAGDIYQKDYQGWYCVGCEEFKTEKELVNDHCPEHKETKLERVKEKNYFFRLSKYQKRLWELITSDEILVVPKTRKNEVLSFINSGLEDFSISRSLKRAKGWGIPVPGNPKQIIYVWFDALSNYITALGYGREERLFKKYWPADLHVIGKGIVRFHAIYWPAMLLSASLPLPRSIFVHGYVTVEGQKISKSQGIVIDPFALVEKYGMDPIRYYLLKEISAYQDGDFSIKRFKAIYNSDLANGLGNFFARVATLAQKYFGGRVPKGESPYKEPRIELIQRGELVWEKYYRSLESFRFDEALGAVWELIQAGDKYLDETEPWILAKSEQKGRLAQVVYNLLESLHQVTWLIYPFMPQTAREIGKRLNLEALLVENPEAKNADKPIKPGAKVSVGKSLFPRI